MHVLQDPGVVVQDRQRVLTAHTELVVPADVLDVVAYRCDRERRALDVCLELVHAEAPGQPHRAVQDLGGVEAVVVRVGVVIRGHALNEALRHHLGAVEGRHAQGDEEVLSEALQDPTLGDLRQFEQVVPPRLATTPDALQDLVGDAQGDMVRLLLGTDSAKHAIEELVDLRVQLRPETAAGELRRDELREGRAADARGVRLFARLLLLAMHHGVHIDVPDRGVDVCYLVHALPDLPQCHLQRRIQAKRRDLRVLPRLLDELLRVVQAARELLEGSAGEERRPIVLLLLVARVPSPDMELASFVHTNLPLLGDEISARR
mmetsp:Transcript_133680/g.387021  ORF Transcript_133680/g.387021 Transcript_133680/m.387021 type:complete len:319 (+) Transcript_133680:783-1739(+)